MLLLTASEPLSLEEEYAMQESWRDDPKKCTFIILSNTLFRPNATEDELMTEDEEIRLMCGDVNLFFNNIDNENDVEIEVMIAERDCQRKGFAREAVLLMMRYGITLGVQRFYAKISSSNLPSRNLFER